MEDMITLGEIAKRVAGHPGIDLKEDDALQMLWRAFWRGEIEEGSVGYEDYSLDPFTGSYWRNRTEDRDLSLDPPYLEESPYRVRWSILEIIVANDQSFLKLLPNRKSEAKDFKYLSEQNIPSSPDSKSVACKISVKISELRRWCNLQNHRWCLEVLPSLSQVTPACAVVNSNFPNSDSIKVPKILSPLAEADLRAWMERQKQDGKPAPAEAILMKKAKEEFRNHSIPRKMFRDVRTEVFGKQRPGRR